MRVFLSVEVGYEPATVKDPEELVRALQSILGEFVAGDGDNLIVNNEVIEHLEYGVSSVPDPCANDGVINKIQEILKAGEQGSYHRACEAALKFCEDYKAWIR